jgi:hypothetical protein
MTVVVVEGESLEDFTTPSPGTPRNEAEMKAHKPEGGVSIKVETIPLEEGGSENPKRVYFLLPGNLNFHIIPIMSYASIVYGM